MNQSLEILKSYSYLGQERLEDGTILIARAPHIAPLAWLHNIYPPLSANLIVKLEEELGGAIPDDYKEFLSLSNGLGVFNTTFSLYGYRRNYKRDDINVWQPFDILTHNIKERPYNATEAMFFIGGYSWDGSLLYIDVDTNTVHICERENADSLFEWPSFDQMLESEIKRLTILFDHEGKKIKKHLSTLPI